MSESLATGNTRTPWHLWVIGTIAILWSAMGAFDYVMTETRNAEYLAKFPPEMLAFVYGLPAWVIGAWAIGVWGGVLGGLLLLFRKRLAVWVFLASLVGVVVANFYILVLSDGMKYMGDPMSLCFTAVIILFALVLVIYARAMSKRGVLV